MKDREPKPKQGEELKVLMKGLRKIEEERIAGNLTKKEVEELTTTFVDEWVEENITSE